MTRSLRILQINSGGGWSGGQYHVLLLSKGLRERGHHNVVVCPPGSALAERASNEGLNVEPLEMRGQWDLSAVRQLRRILKRHRIELINSHKPLPHTIALWARGWGGSPRLVATRHVTFPLRRHLFRTLKWVHGVDGWIAASEAVMASLVASGVPADRIAVIYAPLDAGRFRRGIPGDSIRKEFGIPADAPVIGQVGDLRPWKGYSDFIRAAALVLQARPEAHFLAVGRKNEFYGELSRLAGQLGLSGRLHFTDFRPDVEICYAAMTICVSASTEGEAAPYALKEPLAMGIPVVATRVGGSHEVVTDGVTGLLIPPCDPPALAKAVLQLLDRPELRRTMGQNGERWVRERFSIETTVSRTEALYQRLVRDQ